MKTLSACILLIVVCLPNSESRANGLLQKLPKDGSWVRYHIDMKMTQPQNMEISGTMTIRSVGRETVNNEPCRWIEIQMKAEAGEMKINTISKLLVPEKVFKKGKTVPEKIIRGWEKTNDNDPRKLSETEISNNGQLSPLLLPDFSRKSKTIKEKKVIDYQQGKLEIGSVITGSLMLDQSNNENLKIKTSFVYSLWIHEKVPFGTAAAKWDVTLKRDNNILVNNKMTFTLEDFGTGAKTALPDHN